MAKGFVSEPSCIALPRNKIRLAIQPSGADELEQNERTGIARGIKVGHLILLMVCEKGN